MALCLALSLKGRGGLYAAFLGVAANLIIVLSFSMAVRASGALLEGQEPFARVALGAGRPVGLQVATLAAAERRAACRSARGLRRWWVRAMTRALTRMEAAALRRVDRVFVENAWMLEHVARTAGSSRVVFAPPGVDTDRFTPPERRDGAGHILSVGRMSDPRKVRALSQAVETISPMSRPLSAILAFTASTS